MDDDIFDLDAMLVDINAARGIKDRMKAKNLTACKCTCPKCGVKSAARARLAGVRKHLHMHCTECGWMMME